MRPSGAAKGWRGQQAREKGGREWDGGGGEAHPDGLKRGIEGADDDGVPEDRVLGLEGAEEAGGAVTGTLRGALADAGGGGARGEAEGWEGAGRLGAGGAEGRLDGGGGRGELGHDVLAEGAVTVLDALPRSFHDLRGAAGGLGLPAGWLAPELEAEKGRGGGGDGACRRQAAGCSGTVRRGARRGGRSVQRALLRVAYGDGCLGLPPVDRRCDATDVLALRGTGLRLNRTVRRAAGGASEGRRDTRGGYKVPAVWRILGALTPTVPTGGVPHRWRADLDEASSEHRDFELAEGMRTGWDVCIVVSQPCQRLKGVVRPRCAYRAVVLLIGTRTCSIGSRPLRYDGVGDDRGRSTCRVGHEDDPNMSHVCSKSFVTRSCTDAAFKNQQINDFDPLSGHYGVTEVLSGASLPMGGGRARCAI